MMSFLLSYGDSISESIDHGLAISDYGIVILSKRFFEKGWTMEELNALLNKQVRLNRRIILPMWHDLSADEIAMYSPFMVDKYAARSDEGVKNIAAKFYKQIRGIRTLYNFSSDTELKNNVSAFSKSIRERELLIKEPEGEILLIILTKIYLITKGYRNAYIHFYQFSESLCANEEEARRLEKFIIALMDQNSIASREIQYSQISD
jgi:hypothetical protein